MKGHDLTTPNHCCRPRLAATLLAVAVQTVAAPAVAAPPADLTATEMDGYQRWLYSLDGNGNWPAQTEITDTALALRNGIAAGDVKGKIAARFEVRYQLAFSQALL